MGKQTQEDEERWQFILGKFQDLQKKKGYGQNALLIESVGEIAGSLKGIADGLNKEKGV